MAVSEVLASGPPGPEGSSVDALQTVPMELDFVEPPSKTLPPGTLGAAEEKPSSVTTLEEDLEKEIEKIDAQDSSRNLVASVARPLAGAVAEAESQLQAESSGAADDAFRRSQLTMQQTAAKEAKEAKESKAKAKARAPKAEPKPKGRPRCTAVKAKAKKAAAEEAEVAEAEVAPVKKRAQKRRAEPEPEGSSAPSSAAGPAADGEPARSRARVRRAVVDEAVAATPQPEQGEFVEIMHRFEGKQYDKQKETMHKEFFVCNCVKKKSIPSISCKAELRLVVRYHLLVPQHRWSESLVL